jgi:hypothetical protein
MCDSSVSEIESGNPSSVLFAPSLPVCGFRMSIHWIVAAPILDVDIVGIQVLNT